MTKLRFRAKQNNRSNSKDWKTRNEREDDRIAPIAAAHSIDALQRWALATANIAQGHPRANEAQMVERIRERYESEPYPLDHHKDDMITARSKVPSNDTAAKKRKHSVSLTASPQLRNNHLQGTVEGDLQQLKRHRSRSPGGRAIGDDKNVQSSGWCFPSEDEATFTESFLKKKTYIEID